MNASALARYRNLKNLSRDEWEKLDVFLFIAANFNRYCGSLLKKIGFQHLPSDANATLLSLFCSTAYKPLCSVHEKNLDAVGETRNRIMLGTLKMVSMTRMVDALILEFPAYVPLDRLTLPSQWEDQDHPSSIYSVNDDRHQEEPTSEGDRELLTPEQREQFFAAEDQRISDHIEHIRHLLTVSQHQVIRHLLCDQMDIPQIAKITNTSQTNIRIMLQSIRRRMFGLLPSDMAKHLEDCLLRK